MPIDSNPRTWTLKFKHHTSTFLIHVDPQQPFSVAKRELLLAVTETNPTGTLNGHPIPKNFEDILLAKPVDNNDLSQGWERLQPPEEAEGEVDGKGKGKASAVGGKPSGGVLKDTPMGARLKDGAVVAFRFRGIGEEWEMVDQGDDDDDDDDDIKVAEEDRRRGEVWDVVVPTMEEAYPAGDEAGGG